MNRKARLALALALACALALPLVAQWGRRGFRGGPPGMGFADESVRAEFFFTRLAYQSLYGGWGSQSWLVDWPEAEYHFMQGVKRLTVIDAAQGGKFVRPSDEELFEYPWLYAVEVGRWVLDEQEAAQLREYLLRGGFLMVDDFHGTREWAQFLDSMRRVFPGRPIIDIPETDEVMRLHYELDPTIQIPGYHVARSGQTFEKDGYTPHFRGIYDDEDRLMVSINFNMDLGDAWEHADYPDYPEKMTALAYRFGINYVLYAMTH